MHTHASVQEITLLDVNVLIDVKRIINLLR